MFIYCRLVGCNYGVSFRVSCVRYPASLKTPLARTRRLFRDPWTHMHETGTRYQQRSLRGKTRQRDNRTEHAPSLCPAGEACTPQTTSCSRILALFPATKEGYPRGAARRRGSRKCESPFWSVGQLSKGRRGEGKE